MLHALGLLSFDYRDNFRTIILLCVLSATTLEAVTLLGAATVLRVFVEVLVIVLAQLSGPPLGLLGGRPRLQPDMHP